MISRVFNRGIIFLVSIFILFFQPITGVPPLSAQEPEMDPVRELLLRMSSRMRVGQLVLVSFPGAEVNETSPIVDLIREYSIGGVIFTRANGNFSEYKISPSEILSSTTYLQNVALSSSQTFTDFTMLDSSELYTVPFIPLLLVTRPGPYGTLPTKFITGTSNLPTPLALGASWDPNLAELTGEILGRELSALGFNMYLGPDLDVLYTPNPGNPADLGTQIFGADPFWVGEMGQSYIAGLHTGGQDALVVAPRHLPGLGSADRSLDDEVPTVQKPLELLKQIELAPFFTAAEDIPGVKQTADAFLVTHIKYRGFQGNIRQTTRPISLDAHALQSVYTLPEMSVWREAGGVLVADNLGLPAIHLSYDPRGLSFNGRRVAQDALIAGNDLLILDKFTSNENWDTHFDNVRDTLDYLVTRYEGDPAFKAVVDAAVYRVLKMKLRLNLKYNSDNPGELSASPDQLSVLGASGEINASVAVASLTRVSPITDDLLPSPPQVSNKILIFTQELYAQESPDLDAIPLLQENEVAAAILRLYGADGTGVVRFTDIDSFSFDDLRQALDQLDGLIVRPPVPEGEEPVASIGDIVLASIQNADWIIFASTGLTEAPESVVLKRFLASQANLVNARLVVFAFGPPYELDSTEVSKLDLYYATYSTGAAFVDAAARALFSDLVAPGDSPVDIPAINYYLPSQTMPDSTQVISLYLVNEAGEELTPTTRANIHIGDILNLRTGVIVDRNAHVVPDNTPVQFSLAYPQEGIDQTVIAESHQGIAQTSVTLDRVGQLHITVKSEPAVSSLRLELTIRDDGVTITEVEPSPTPTSTPEPTSTPSPTPTPTPILVMSSEHLLPEKISLPQVNRLTMLLWGLGGVIGIGLIAFLWYRERSVSPADAVRLVLWGVIGGIIVYIAGLIGVRWVWPAVHFMLVDREYIFGAVSASGGIFVLFLGNNHHQKE